MRPYATYILSGVAGAGKSTIAYEFADRLERKNRLGATFFFGRGSEKLSTTTYVIPSLARQLARYRPDLRPRIAAAVRDHVHLAQHQHLEYQLEELIVKPLASLPLDDTAPDHPPTVIILDALDECEGPAQDDIRHLLHLLHEAVRALKFMFPLRMLLTTRPELHIEKVLTTHEFGQATRPFKLHEVPRSTVDSDITLFLETKLLHSADENLQYLTRERPHVIADLVKAADGLFIYAFTAFDFLSNALYPEQAVEKFDLLLSTRGSVETNSRLDKLYLSVLQTVFPEHDLEDSQYRIWLRDTLGAIALLADHISPETLASLSGLTPSKIQLILRHLGSLVISFNDLSKAIRPLHASFPQFLIDNARCTNASFLVDAQSGHARIATRCLQILAKPDALRAGKYDMPLHLQYSCVHWATHLAGASHSDGLRDLLTRFLQKRLLLWFEALSHLGRLEVAAPALLRVRSWYKVRIWKRVYVVRYSLSAPSQLHFDTDSTLSLLHDAYRFVLEFFVPIQADPTHIYKSALPLTPHCTLRDLYSPHGPHKTAVRMTTEASSHWSACLRTMEGHSGWVNSVSFSSDGSSIVSGSLDCTARIWNTRSGTGTPLSVMKHERWVRVVAYSPDVNSRQIVTGCDDKFVRTWDVASGDTLHSFGPTAGKIISVAYTPDGKRIFAGDDSGRLHSWDAASGESAHVSTLGSSDSNIYSIAFSPDGSLAVTASDDKQVRLWYSDPFQLRELLRGHTKPVTGAVFTHEGNMLISGSVDKTVRIWDVDTAVCLKVLDCPAQISAIAVIATTIAVGLSSADSAIHTWDAQSYEPLGVLKNHTQDVTSLAFSPDSQYLVSASKDSSVCMWDLSVGRATEHIPQGHAARINCISFSRCTSRVATGSEDRTIGIWDASTGQQIQVLKGHIESVGAVAFSLDGRRLVSGGDDSTVRVWDLESNTLSLTLDGYQGRITAVASSSNGQLLASVAASDPKPTVRIWRISDSESKLVNTFNVSKMVTQLSFCSNDSHLHATTNNSADPIFVWNIKTGGQLRKAGWGDHRSTWDKHMGLCDLTETLPDTQFTERNGWITRCGSIKKLCWLPGSRRGRSTEACSESYYAVGTSTGRLTILDLAMLDRD